MKKSTLLMVLSLVLALALGVGGTMAYLQDTDSDVNVMTLGNVYIVQNEQEFDTAGNLVEFTQDKPLYPYVGELGWKNTEEDPAYRQFTMNNVVDKYVTVTNTGKSDAYVRTFIALEMGEYTEEEFEMIGVSINAANGSEFKFPGAWVWGEGFVAEIDGNNYYVMVAEHQDAVKPGETTIPSLNQIYLKNTAGNEEVEKLDGNGNGKYDVLVLSQAVQTQGFENAAEALAAAFPYGEDKPVTVAGWFGEAVVGSPGNKNDTNNPPEIEEPLDIPASAKKITNQDELKEAFATGGVYEIVEAFEVNEVLTVVSDVDLYNADPSNVLGFVTAGRIVVSDNVALSMYGVELDGQGSYSITDGDYEANDENLRKTPLILVKAGANLLLDGGSHIKNAVTKGKAQGPIAAEGTENGDEIIYATVTLKEVLIEGCVGIEGVVLGLNQYAEAYIEDGATISGNYAINNYNHGIFRIYTSSNLIMNGGTIENNMISGNGMIGLYGNSKMIMNGGNIRKNGWMVDLRDGNRVNGWSPMIYVHSNSLFEMNGGAIYDNKVRYGAINSLNSDRVPAIDVNGGFIANNIATNLANREAAFVVISSGSDTLTVSSAAEVSGDVWEYYDENGDFLREYTDLTAYID